MRFIIRADASSKIGTGHVMRCSAIAEELIGRGKEIVFVGEIEGLPWVQARVNTLGFSKIYSNPANFRSNSNSDVLILDSYKIDPLDPLIDSRKWRKVVALVDDTTPKFQANLYIHPGPKTTWLPPEMEREVRFISGIEYTPIRKSLRNLKRNTSSDNRLAPKIAIIGGGSDPFDFCGNLVSVLQGLSADFSANTFTNNKIPCTADARFSLVEIGTELEDFLVETDLVFTTAGTSSWEMLSCGFPIGLACAADNQSANYLYQVDKFLAVGIGKRDLQGRWKFNEIEIENLIQRSELRNLLARNARMAVDGRGAKRIVGAILEDFQK